MRKLLIIGSPVLIVLGAAAAWHYLHHGDSLTQGRVMLGRGDMKGAELYLRQAVKEDPKNTLAAFLLGKVDLAVGNPSGAELELKRARAGGFDKAAIILPLGDAYLAQHHFTEALRDFTVADAPPSARADVLTVRAGAQLSLGDYKTAWATITDAEKTLPISRETILTAARIALALQDMNGAASRAATLLTADPKDPDALLIQSEVAIRNNDPATALARAQTALASNPGRQDARLLEARAYAALNKFTEARASVQKLLHDYPKNIGANYLLIILAVQAGDYQAADGALTTIATALADLPRGFYFLAVTKLGIGQPAQAEEAIVKFLATNPDDLSSLKLLAYIHLARRQPDRALELLHAKPLADHVDSETIDLEGRALAMQGHMVEAQAKFAKANAMSPGSLPILNRLAAADLDLGNVAAADDNLRASLKKDPNQRLAGEAIVQTDLARGDFAQARADVERLRTAVGDGEEVGILAAQVRIASLDTEGGEAQLLDVLKRFPDSKAAVLNLVRIYGLRGDAEKAEALLLEYLHRHSSDETALSVLLPALVADKKMDQAIKVAEAAHSAYPDNVAIITDLATLYVRAHQPERAVGLLDRTSANSNPQLDGLRARVLAAGGHVEQAIAAYQAVIRQTPGDIQARTDLATLMIANKQYDDARAELTDGLSQTPGNPPLLGALVAVDLRQGGPQQAEATAASLRADPQNMPAAAALAGDIWIAAGDSKKAAAAYGAAFKATPSAELASKTAMALAASGNTDQAIGLLATWVAAHPDDGATQAALSSLYISTGRLDDAESHLQAVLKLRHDDVAALNNLAWVMAQKGDLATAANMAERAYFASPVPSIADTLGSILARQGNNAMALNLLSQAIGNQDPAGRADAEFHYASVLNQTGKTDEARVQLQRALASKVRFENKAAAEKLLATLSK